MTFQAEIVEGDPLFTEIVALVIAHRPKTILEIGSADGSGSTQAFVQGIQGGGLEHDTTLFCIEPHPARVAQLKERVGALPYVDIRQTSSVARAEYLNEAGIRFWMKDRGYRFNIKRYSVDTVLSWLEDELHMLEEHGVPERGIAKIKKDHRLPHFDMVLIDGSAFTGWFDFYHTLGSKVFILDDTLDIKCNRVVHDLLADPAYEMVSENKEYRNGYAVFCRQT